MLIADVERYLELRKTQGFKLRNTSMNLRAFARFADSRGETHVRATTAIEWAFMASSPYLRDVHLRDVVKLARFLVAEDPSHEVPPRIAIRESCRPLPYIYTPDEICQILVAASNLRRQYPLRRAVYTTMLGLIVSTGLRLSEAIGLRFDDVSPEGVLRISHTKFGKSRLVPLHATTKEALDYYLHLRRAVSVPDDHLFLSVSNRGIPSRTVEWTFQRILKVAKIAPERTRKPRIHDLRHTFATRALERCSSERQAVSRHFVALSTYLGHIDVRSTYWYLQSTPELMVDIAAAGEVMAIGGER